MEPQKPIDEISLATSILNAKLLGIAADGSTKLFNIGDIKGDYKGLATSETDPGMPVLQQYYDAVTGVTYPNFGNITIPVKVENQYVIAPKLFWDGAAWDHAWSLVDLPIGPQGWAPIFSAITDGVRIIQQLTDFAGGSGVKPTEGIGKYVGSSGLVDLVSDAVDYRGAQGATGAAGGTEIPPYVMGNTYTAGSQRRHLGDLWIANANTLTTDVPGSSAKWDRFLPSVATKIDLQNDMRLILGSETGINLENILFEKGRWANGAGTNVEVVDWCLRSTNYFASTVGTYYVKAKDGFRFSIVESTTGNINTAADASLTSNTYVSSGNIVVTKPFLRLQLVKWNLGTNAPDNTYVFDLAGKAYLSLIQILKAEDKVSLIEKSIASEISNRENVDASFSASLIGVSDELTRTKAVDGVVTTKNMYTSSFVSQNANVNNQKTIIIPLISGTKYNFYIKSFSALGQTQIKVILYWASNAQSQTIVDTNANDLSKGLNVPFVANGPIDFLNVQLYGVANTGFNVDVAVSILAQSDLKSYKQNKCYPFVSATTDQYNIAIRALVKDVKLIGSGWNPADFWCFRLFRKNTASNFLLSMYKSLGNDTIIDNGTNVSVSAADIDLNRSTGIQEVNKVIDANRAIHLKLDMAYYATLSVFQTDLHYNQTGIAKEAYNTVINPYFNATLKTDKPIITLIDDDGSLSFKGWLKTSLDIFGYKAGIGVVTNWVGTTSFMTKTDLQNMVTAGHELMCHSQTHDPSFWYPSSWQNPLIGYNQDAIETECKVSRKWFLDNGFGLVENFVYPNGGYDGIVNKPYRMLTIETVRKYYQNALSTVPGQNNTDILDNYMLNRVQVNMAVNNLAYYQGLIDTCKANAGWLVLFTHSDNSTEVNQSFYESILSAIQASGIGVMKFSDAVAIKGNIASIGVMEQGNSLYIGRKGGLQ